MLWRRGFLLLGAWIPAFKSWMLAFAKDRRPLSRHERSHLGNSTIHTRSDLRSPDPKDPLGSSPGPNTPGCVEEIGGGGAAWSATPPPSAAPPPISYTRLGIFRPAEDQRGSLGSGERKSDRGCIVEMPRCDLSCLYRGRRSLAKASIHTSKARIHAPKNLRANGLRSAAGEI